MQQLSAATNRLDKPAAVDMLCRLAEHYQAQGNLETALAYFRRAERLASSDERCGFCGSWSG